MSESSGARRVRRGQIVEWESDRYRVLRRRAVDGLAMVQTASHEVYLASLDGGTDPEWVPENEPVGVGGTGGMP
ncbi:hypothetical protein J0H58_14800 [bacterium]|nr:hypothetical protein [bacterium]